MKTTIELLHGDATRLHMLADASVDLVLTSPPYPMIAMWDAVFADQDRRIGESLRRRGGAGEAFEGMHALLDRAWGEAARVLKPGGIACINIGDATRTLGGDFQLYSNHSRILAAFLRLGFAALPDIVWRKQTNAPNKFLGSGTLPVGAYVTYEHEYVLILRKGPRRRFHTPQEKRLRQESAFFWEERNTWFSDVWSDIKGSLQELKDKATRQRSGAFPFELAYRLICMYSIKGDTVLDPFAGTGTSLVAALTSGRNAIGVERDRPLVAMMRARLHQALAPANDYLNWRLQRHAQFVARRTRDGGALRYTNRHYGFPVMSRQERELLLNPLEALDEIRPGRIDAWYADRACFEWCPAEPTEALPPAGARGDTEALSLPGDALPVRSPPRQPDQMPLGFTPPS